MTIKGLLFDKDGTLIDFNHTWLPLYQQAADYLVSLSPRSISRESLLGAGGYQEASNSWLPDSLLAAGSNSQIYAHWQALTGLAIEGDILHEIETLFSAESHSYRAVIDDLAGWLSSLKQAGYALGVATMDNEMHARHALTSLGATVHFDFICGADSGYGVKPQAGMIEAFYRACALEPAEIAMIGDSPRDLQMAANAGSPYAIGVLTGASTRESLQPFASYILPSIAELPPLLREIEAGR